MSEIESYIKNRTFNSEIRFIFSVTILIVLSFVLPNNLMAQGDLLIFPKRVVFEGTQRFHELNIANTGQDTARYSVSFVQIRMNEDGSFETITKPDSGQNFADGFVRIFPRAVILSPGEAQLVKIQLTRTNMLTSGEYRSHLYFRSTQQIKPLSSSEKDSLRDTTSIAVRLVPVYGITIPVIIRVGEDSTKVSLTDFNFKMMNDSTPSVGVVINRSGNMSIYGDIKINYVPPIGNLIQVGSIQGVAVYTPNLLRRCIIKLNNFAGIDFSRGKLHLVYSAQRDDKAVKIAETELQLK